MLPQEKSIKTDIRSLLYSKHILNLLHFTGNNKRKDFPIDLFLLMMRKLLSRSEEILIPSELIAVSHFLLKYTVFFSFLNL